MKQFYVGSYLKLTVCMLSLTGFSEDLSARSFSSYSEKFSEIKDSLRKGVSVRALRERVKSRLKGNQPTWTSLQELHSARQESEGALGSVRGNSFKKKHVKRLEHMASLKKIENIDNPYCLSIAERLVRSDSRGIQAKGKNILWKIASKPTNPNQQAAIKVLLESGDDKLVKKGHKAQQTILKQPNDARFVDVSIYYFKLGSPFPKMQEQASANLKQLLMNPHTSLEDFKRIIGEIKHYHTDFRDFIHEQFAKESTSCAEVLKDNNKKSIIRRFLGNEKRKSNLSLNGDQISDRISKEGTPAPERDWRDSQEVTEL